MTDDPETPPLHGWEINVPITLEHETGEDVLEMPLLDINYGLTGQTCSSRWSSAPARAPGRGWRTERGLSDTSVGVKWRFLEEEPGMAPDGGLPPGDDPDRG